jgi:hypothetical protein
MKKLILIIGVLAIWLMPLFTFAQEIATEAPPPVEEVPYVAQVVKWSNALYNLPAIPLVVIGCIMVGYFAKLVPIIPNTWIPGIVFLVGIAANLVMTPLNSGPDWARAVILGLVAGGGSIFVHRKWLKDWIDIDVFGDIGKKASVIILLGLLAGGSVGCVNLARLKPVAVAEGQDAYLVNAERVHVTSLEAYISVTNWELNNRESLPVEVSRAVDKVRSEFKPAWNEADKILEDYRTNRMGISDLERLTAALQAAQDSMLRLKSDKNEAAKLFAAISDLTGAVAQLRN